MDCAQQHLGARWLLKFDLKNFFGSIDEVSVYRAFRDGGYNSLIAFEMARICTRMPGQYPQYPLAVVRQRYSTIRAYASGRQGVLPQGAPTSGALANAATMQLDDRLSAIADTFGLVYTRYSDDLTFSTAFSWNRDTSSSLSRAVQRAAVNEGFQLNSKKTRVVPPGARHIVLGLLVDGDKVRLLPEFRQRLAGHIRGVEVFGLADHARSRSFRSVLSFVRFIDGHVAYALSVDREWALSLRARWEEALGKKGYPIHSRDREP